MNRNETQFVPEVILDFAAALGTQVRQNKILIPAAYGSGYCLGYKFNPQIRMLVLDYTLHQNMELHSPESDIQGKMLLFKLQHVLPEKQCKPTALPSVLIATRKMHGTVLMPVHSHTATINIEIDTAYLSSLFSTVHPSVILNKLLQNEQPLLFEEVLSPALLQIVDKIINGPGTDGFQLFYLRVKAEELVCQLLMELEKRQESQLLPINQQDISSLYHIRGKILEHLDIPPTLDLLASQANMSISKLKKIFKQVFGKSIYSYYQQFRIEEAARLLLEEKLSVSEGGYWLGFSNLSHFSRVFEQHIGLKPKKYAMGK